MNYYLDSLLSGFIVFLFCVLFIHVAYVCFVILCPRYIAGVPFDSWQELHGHLVTAHHAYAFSTSREG